MLLAHLTSKGRTLLQSQGAGPSHTGDQTPIRTQHWRWVWCGLDLGLACSLEVGVMWAGPRTSLFTGGGCDVGWTLD